MVWMIFLWFFDLCLHAQQVLWGCYSTLHGVFWQGMDRSDQPNFPPQRFPTKSVLTARKPRQKGREWWVGLKMDLNKNRLDFLSIQTFPPNPIILLLDLSVLNGHPLSELGGSAQNLPKFQIPYLTPKNVQTCWIHSPDGDPKVWLKKMTPSCPTGAL